MTPQQRAKNIAALLNYTPTLADSNYAAVIKEIGEAERDHYEKAVYKCIEIAKEETALCRRAKAPEDVLSGQVGASTRIKAKIENLLQNHQKSNSYSEGGLNDLA